MRANMLLKDRFPDQEIPDVEISSVTERSSDADERSVFVCIRGARADGHDYAADAYARGCRIVVAERPLDLPPDCLVLSAKDTEEILAHLADRLCGHPSGKLRVVGITGTKGKTTTARLLCHILNRAGIPSGYIGTNGVRFGSVERETVNTTPDAVTLQKTFAEMHDAGMKVAVVEVSSQALYRRRVDGTAFDAVIFTNFSADHVGAGEHPDMEHYFACKHRLFTDFGARYAIWNDTPKTERMREGCPAPRQIFCSSRDEGADFSISAPRPTRDGDRFGISFSVRHGKTTLPCFLPLIGLCNAEDALLAIATAVGVFSIPFAAAVDALRDARVEGRSEIVGLPSGGVAVIDYAHNGESLRRMLSSLREYRPKRLLCLFGSVGGRTESRRAELGAVASELADLCILTSDNPDREAPEKIIAEIAEAFRGSQTPFYEIPDRAEAIRFAVGMTQKGDVLLLAGKGHETYQIVGGRKIPFSEKEILSRLTDEASVAGIRSSQP